MYDVLAYLHFQIRKQNFICIALQEFYFPYRKAFTNPFGIKSNKKQALSTKIQGIGKLEAHFIFLGFSNLNSEDYDFFQEKFSVLTFF